MDRIACVDVAALPLQLLLRERQEWSGLPVAVLESNRPQGRVLWVNERARAHRILPGMRYAAALSLSAALRAAEVSSSELERVLESIAGVLREYTPQIERSAEEPGVFWLGASGLERLYDSLAAWAELLHRALRERERMECAVVVGFNKFFSYAVARARRGVTVFENAGDERRTAQAVALERLAIAPPVRDVLEKLDVRTLGDYAALPLEGIEKRFGKIARHFHRLARCELVLPLVSEPPPITLARRHVLDHGETDLARLMVLIGRLTQDILSVLAARDAALAKLFIRLMLERGGELSETIQPASATLDLVHLSELAYLRLSGVKGLAAGVCEVILNAESRRATREQLELFADAPTRDLEAANRALARIRAEFGEHSVVRARLREAHLPEASFYWEALSRVELPGPRSGSSCGRLVRRLLVRPVALPHRPRHEPDGWMLRGLRQGPVVRVLGPYIVAGGWWNRPIRREYHFAETRNGELLWAYYDRFRRRWFLQGRVE